MDQRVQAAARYAAEGMETLSVSTIIGMTTAQHARYTSVPTQSGVWRQREAELCDALNSVVEGRPAKAIEVLGIAATAYDRMRAIHACYRKLSVARLKELEEQWAVGEIAMDGAEPTTFKAGMSPASFLDELDLTAEEMLRLCPASRLDVITSMTSDASKHRIMLQAWEKIVEEESAATMPKYELMTARHANYLDLEPTATRHTYTAIRAKLIEVDDMFGLKKSTSAAAFGDGATKGGKAKDEIRCYDCNAAGVKRGHDECPNPGSLEFAPDWLKDKMQRMAKKKQGRSPKGGGRTAGQGTKRRHDESLKDYRMRKKRHERASKGHCPDGINCAVFGCKKGMHPPGWTGGSGVTSEKVASASVALFNSGAQRVRQPVRRLLRCALTPNRMVYRRR